MNAPIRTTVVFALASGVLVLPFTGIMHGFAGSPTALKCFLWLDLALYVLLLARWSRTRLLLVLFPLALVLGAVFWPGARLGFSALALGVLCWARSGLCYNGAPLRAIIAELITVGGGITLVGSLGSHSTFTWPLGLCLFTLMQTLYFYIVPMESEQTVKNTCTDPFAQACHEAQKVLAQPPQGRGNVAPMP